MPDPITIDLDALRERLKDDDTAAHFRVEANDEQPAVNFAGCIMDFASATVGPVVVRVPEGYELYVYGDEDSDSSGLYVMVGERDCVLRVGEGWADLENFLTWEHDRVCKRCGSEHYPWPRNGGVDHSPEYDVDRFDEARKAVEEVVARANLALAFVREQQAARAIHAAMDGEMWVADTLDAIAYVLHGAGLDIRPPEQDAAE